MDKNSVCNSVLPRLLLQGAAPCPLFVTPCPFEKAEMTPCPFDKFFFFKYHSHMAFSSVLPFLLPTHSVDCAVHLLLSHSRALLVSTVEPLTNDHPHQRPSLSYDHISCDGQWFLFVYESLTSDHPSYTTTPM